MLQEISLGLPRKKKLAQLMLLIPNTTAFYAIIPYTLIPLLLL